MKKVSKEELFKTLNAYGISPSDQTLETARKTFGDFHFYILHSPGSGNGRIDDKLSETRNLKPLTLINIKTQSKAVPFFTSLKEATEFAANKKSNIICISYNSFKKHCDSGIIDLKSFDGIIINPNSENIFLPCDFPII